MASASEVHDPAHSQPTSAQPLPLRPVAQRCGVPAQPSEADTAGQGSVPRKRKPEDSPLPLVGEPAAEAASSKATSSHSVSGGVGAEGDARGRGHGQGAPPPGWAPHKSAWKRYKETTPESEGTTPSPSASASGQPGGASSAQREDVDVDMPPRMAYAAPVCAGMGIPAPAFPTAQSMPTYGTDASIPAGEAERPASVPPRGAGAAAEAPTTLAQMLAPLALPSGRMVSTSLPLPGAASQRAAPPHAFGSARSAPPACGILSTLFAPEAGAAALGPHALSPGMRGALLAALAAPSCLPPSWFGASGAPREAAAGPPPLPSWASAPASQATGLAPPSARAAASAQECGDPDAVQHRTKGPAAPPAPSFLGRHLESFLQRQAELSPLHARTAAQFNSSIGSDPAQGVDESPGASTVEAAAAAGGGLTPWASLLPDLESSMRRDVPPPGLSASLPLPAGTEAGGRAGSSDWHKLVGPGPSRQAPPSRSHSTTAEISVLRATAGLPASPATGEAAAAAANAQLRQLLSAPLGQAMLGGGGRGEAAAPGTPASNLAAPASNLGAAHLLRPPDSAALQEAAREYLRKSSWGSSGSFGGPVGPGGRLGSNDSQDTAAAAAAVLQQAQAPPLRSSAPSLELLRSRAQSLAAPGSALSSLDSGASALGRVPAHLRHASLESLNQALQAGQFPILAAGPPTPAPPPYAAGRSEAGHGAAAPLAVNYEAAARAAVGPEGLSPWELQRVASALPGLLSSLSGVSGGVGGASSGLGGPGAAVMRMGYDAGGSAPWGGAPPAWGAPPAPGASPEQISGILHIFDLFRQAQGTRGALGAAEAPAGAASTRPLEAEAVSGPASGSGAPPRRRASGETARGSSGGRQRAMGQVCAECGTDSTPAWRRDGPRLLCNACGLRRRKGG